MSQKGDMHTSLKHLSSPSFPVEQGFRGASHLACVTVCACQRTLLGLALHQWCNASAVALLTDKNDARFPPNPRGNDGNFTDFKFMTQQYQKSAPDFNRGILNSGDFGRRYWQIYTVRSRPAYFFRMGGKSVHTPSNTSAAMPMDSPRVGCG